MSHLTDIMIQKVVMDIGDADFSEKFEQKNLKSVSEDRIHILLSAIFNGQLLRMLVCNWKPISNYLECAH